MSAFASVPGVIDISEGENVVTFNPASWVTVIVFERTTTVVVRGVASGLRKA